jgi:hypothetical protein
MIDEPADYSWLVQEAKTLAAECKFGQATLIAAAVACLERIADRLEDIDIRLADINYELEARRGLHKDHER